MSKILNKRFLKGIIVAFAIICIAVFMQITVGVSKNFWAFPINILCIGIIILGIFAWGLWFKNSTTGRFLAHIETSTSAIFVFALILLIPGLLEQNGSTNSTTIQFLLRHSVESLPVILLLAYILLLLGITIIRKKPKANLHYIGFTINHLALWITLCFAMLSAADKKDYRMIIAEGSGSDKGIMSDLSIHTLPFEILLSSSSEFQANISIFNKKSNLSTNYIIKANHPAKYESYNIYLKSYEKRADRPSLTILQIIEDKWDTAIYIGLILMLFGSAILFFNTSKDG